MAATHSAARTPDVLTATLLTPEGETQIFKGASAFLQAWDTAPAGSTITLSPGTFDNPRYVENVTIIGSGIEDDPDNGIIPTVSKSSINLGSNCNIEGMRIGSIGFNSSAEQISNVQLTKCQITSLNMGYKSKAVNNNFTIRQCVIGEIRLGLERPYANELPCLHNNLLISNSHISQVKTSHTDKSSSILFDHCLITAHNYTLTLGTFTNSITKSGASDDAIVKNCIFLDGAKCSSNVAEFVYQESSENIFKESMENLEWETGKNFRINQPENNWANDGTEIGLYGGLYPFNPAPRIPRIVECEVDRSVVKDGKLKVHVKVEAQTED